MRAGPRARAPVFAALGDKTRLALVAKLCDGRTSSISRLTEGSRLTRQAITKHLRVLEDAGIVRSVRARRESLFELNLKPLEEIKGVPGLSLGAMGSSAGQAQVARRGMSRARGAAAALSP